QRGDRRGLDGARHPHLSGVRLAQSGAGAGMGVHAIDPHHAPADGRADVSADARRLGPGDAGIGAVTTGDSGIDVGLAWYRREDYPCIREIMVDRDELHDKPMMNGWRTSRI